jgi:hypothetical protein
MKLVDAKSQTLNLIQRDIAHYNLPTVIDLNSPDRDPGKFVLDGKIARVIAPFNGFYLISL